MTQWYQSFLVIVFGIFIVNLFSMNSFLPVWSGAEEASIEGAKEMLYGGLPPNLSSLVIGLLDFRYEDIGTNRVPGGILMMFAFLGIYVFGKKVFGKRTILLTLVVLASSFLVVNVAKFATGDAWLFCFQSLIVFFTILFLKQPRPIWNGWHAVVTGLSLLINPISTLILVITLGVFLFIYHPNGKALRGLYWWFIATILVGFSFLKGFPNFDTHNPFFINFGQVGLLSYPLFMIYGMMPWFAFLPPGLRHSFKRLRQKEELSVILIGVLIAGTLSCSLIPQLAFALIVAKQLEGYFLENYPYTNLVKIGAVIHLLIIVVIVMLLMIGGWQELQGIGFRTMMVFGTIYWFTTFIGVIGIFGKNRNLLLGSIAISGCLVTFLFWGQVFPLLMKTTLI